MGLPFSDMRFASLIDIHEWLHAESISASTLQDSPEPPTTSIVFTCSRPLMSVTEGRPVEVLGVCLEVESFSTAAKDVVLGVTFGLTSGAFGGFDAFEKTRSAPCKKVL